MIGDREEQQYRGSKTSFESLDILIMKWRDGTFREIWDDWRWIFTYSKRYKGAILFYIILGMDFLVMNNAIMDFYHRRIALKPNNKEKFFFKGRSLLNDKMIISSIQA